MATWSGSASGTVAVPIERVWEIAQFGNLYRWDSNIESSDIVEGDGYSDGSVRCVTFNYSDGSTGSLHERLTNYDGDDYTYSYDLDSNPFGYEGYSATFKLEDCGDGTTTVDWSFELDAMDSSDENATVSFIESVFQRRITLLEDL